MRRLGHALRLAWVTATSAAASPGPGALQMRVLPMSRCPSKGSTSNLTSSWHALCEAAGLANQTLIYEHNDQTLYRNGTRRPVVLHGRGESIRLWIPVQVGSLTIYVWNWTVFLSRAVGTKLAHLIVWFHANRKSIEWDGLVWDSVWIYRNLMEPLVWQAVTLVAVYQQRLVLRVTTYYAVWALPWVGSCWCLWLTWDLLRKHLIALVPKYQS